MRRTVKILLGFVALLLVAVLTIPLWIDHAAKAAIEEGGTYALGVPTRLEKIRLSLFGGEARLSGLQVDNPEGFRTPHFVRLANGQVAVNLKSLQSDRVVVPTLVLDDVEVNLDRNERGANYEVILENLEKFESKEESAEDAKTFVIEEVLIRNVRVAVKLSLGGVLKPTVPLRIDELRFENVGAEPIPLARVIGIVLKGLMRGITEAGVGKLPREILGGLEQELARLAPVRTAVRILGEGLGGAGKVVEGLGGLLGGDRRKEEEDK